MKYVVLIAIVFVAGFFLGRSNIKEKVVYQTKTEYVKEYVTEYVKDPDSITRSTLDSEVVKARDNSYKTGYTEGRKTGIDEGYESGYKSGYMQGTEYGQSLILDQIDLQVQKAEKTNKNIPLFKVKRN